MVTLYLYREQSVADLGYNYLVVFKEVSYKKGPVVNTSTQSLLNCLGEDENLLYQAKKALSGESPGFAVSRDIWQKIIDADTGITPEESERALRVEQELQRQEKRMSKNSALAKVSAALRMLSEAVDELKEDYDD